MSHVRHYRVLPWATGTSPSLESIAKYQTLAYSYALNEQGTCFAHFHSLPHKRWPLSAMFSSNEISWHNLNSNIPYRPNTAHALHSFCIQAWQTISAMLSIATTLQPPTTYPTPHAINIHYTPTTTHHTAFHNPSLTQSIFALSDSKMAQDVGMMWVLWCHSHLVWLDF